MQIAWIDTETGGLDPSTSALLSVAVVTSNGKSFEARIKAADGLVCTPEALAINGLNPEEGEAEAVVARKLAQFLATSNAHVLGGANCAFDVAFIRAMSARVHIDILGWPGKRAPVDILSIALYLRDMGKMMFEKANLNQVAACLNLSRSGAFHGAMEDTMLARDCYNAMLKL